MVSAAHTIPLCKRKSSALEEHASASDSEDAAFQTEGLLDAGESDEDDEDREKDTDEEVYEANAGNSESVESEDDGLSNESVKENEVSDAATSISGDEGEDENYKTESEKRKIVIDSRGNPRYIYPEIDPVYDSDDSDVAEGNTIGNIPISLYDEYPYVGYDINGKKIMRPAKGKALDALLDRIEMPKGWTGIVDKNTGTELNLSQEELEILRKIQMGEVKEEGYDPYAPQVVWFSSKLKVTPISSAPEPKRRFVPSKHEAKRVMKIVQAIREGRIVSHKPREEKPPVYDIWADEVPRPDHIMNIAAPKLPPPTHAESYNPPVEYLLTDGEKKEWEEKDPEERERDYLPHKYPALRLVPGYDHFINERFERCLDLYLAPRVRRKKLNIDPESLLPKLPSPQDLRPFPTTTATVYRGHEGRVRSISVDQSGVWLATGGDDGTVRIWEILTGREIWKIRIDENEAVNAVEWRPSLTPNEMILTAATGDDVHLLVPPIFDPEIEAASKEICRAGYSYQEIMKRDTSKKEPPGKWCKPFDRLLEQGSVVVVTVRTTVKHISWHRRGDYFTTVSPDGQNRAVAIHQLSKHQSQSPFRKSKGIVQRAEFHPFRPILFVATQRYVRSYDLQKAELARTLQPGARWISSFDVHPRGDNIIVGAYDKRLLWHDMELSTKPYRTLRYHEKAIRAVKYHQRLPLFCSSSDDGTIQVFHGKVFADSMENPLIVPLKVLKGHSVRHALGVLGVDWHPKECWLFSAGADGTARLWN